MLMKLFYTLKSIGTFGITFQYLIKSYYQSLIHKNIDFTDLKQQWSNHILRYMGYKKIKIGEFSKEGPVIYVGNHMSYLDILALMSDHPKVNFLAKKEIQKWPILGTGADRVGTLYVDRESKKDRKLLREQIGRQLIEKKSHLVIFPSGTTTLNEEKPWKRGIFEVAQEFNIPVQVFKLEYSPQRESAFIDDDNIISTMTQQFNFPEKTVHLTWLNQFKIHDAEKQTTEIHNYLKSQLSVKGSK